MTLIELNKKTNKLADQLKHLRVNFNKYSKEELIKFVCARLAEQDALLKGIEEYDAKDEKIKSLVLQEVRGMIEDTEHLLAVLKGHKK